MPSNPSSDRNRWIVGGIAGLSVAAALVALFLFTRPDEVADPLVPATQSTIMVVAPSTSAPTTSSAPATAPVATAPTEPTTSSTSAPATTTPPTTAPSTTAAPTTVPSTTLPADRPSELVVAGPGGVTRDGAVITDQPMARALPLPEGRTIMQREFNDSDAIAESALLVVDDGSSEPVPLAVPSAFDGAVLRLHDAAVVDGESIVIVETRPGLCANPTDCIGAIWAWGPDSGRLDQLQEKIVWEGGWTRLSITTSGLVFGAETETVTSTLRSWAVPGSGAEPVDVATVGLEPSYGDCTDCPNGFTIDRTGTYIGWVETDLTTFQTTLALANLDESAVDRLPLVDDGTVCCLDGVGPDLPVIPVVELDLSVVGDQSTIRAVVNDEGVLNGAERRPALVVNVASGEVTTADGFHVFG